MLLESILFLGEYANCTAHLIVKLQIVLLRLNGFIQVRHVFSSRNKGLQGITCSFLNLRIQQPPVESIKSHLETLPLPFILFLGQTTFVRPWNVLVLKFNVLITIACL